MDLLSSLVVDFSSPTFEVALMSRKKKTPQKKTPQRPPKVSGAISPKMPKVKHRPVFPGTREDVSVSELLLVLKDGRYAHITVHAYLNGKVVIFPWTEKREPTGESLEVPLLLVDPKAK